MLRVPGTNNYKDNDCVPCTIAYNSGIVYTQTDFNNKCDKLIADNGISILTKKQVTANVKDNSWAAQELNKFTGNNQLVEGLDRIVTQCPQLSTMGFGQEPVWRAAICLCKRCVDGEQWIHKLSAMDESRYTAEKTNEYIAKSMAAAVHCKTFEQLRGGICINCSHYGKLTSPIQLAKVSGVEAQRPVLDVLQYPAYNPPAVPYKSYGDTDFFCDQYGIWRKQIDDAGQPIKPVQITNAVIEYLYSTITASPDKAKEAVDVFRIYVIGSQQPFIRYFPTRILYDFKKIMEWCGDNRLIALASQKALAEFMNAYVRQQVSQGSVKLRSQYGAYGWTETTSGEQQFILDEYAILASGAVPIAPTQPTLDHDDMPFVHAGSLEEWKKVPNLYKELHQPLGQLAICMAFAAPFLHYGTGEAKNCIMNIYSYEGGRGKSHLLKACASVYGNPAKAFLQNSASSTATQRYLALNKHLPTFMDEIGNRADDDLASLVFTMINGVEKQKLNRNSSIKQTGWWSTAIFTTANKPLKEIMSRVFANTDAGVLRVMDCECTFTAPELQSNEFTLINDCFHILENNYGLAGPAFIHQVLKDPARLDTLASIANAFVVNNKFHSNERFYSYPLAIALTIGRWAVEFGLLEYDMQELENWVLYKLLPDIRTDDTSNAPDFENDLNEFINENLRRNCLVVLSRDRTDKDKQQITPSGIFDTYVIQYPTNVLTMRYELDSHTLMFSQKAFVDWCKKEGKSSRRIIAKLKASNVLETLAGRYNLGKCVPRYASTRVRCHMLMPDYLIDNPLPFENVKPAYVPYEQLSAQEKEQLRSLQTTTKTNIVGNSIDSHEEFVIKSDIDAVLTNLGL